MNKIIQQVSDVVADKPVMITVDIRPQNKWQELLQRLKILPIRKKLYLRPIVVGNLWRITSLLNRVDGTPFDFKDATKLLARVHESMEKEGKIFAEIIAIAIHNKELEPPLKLIRFVEYNFSAKDLTKVSAIVLKQMDPTAFMSTIISLKGMSMAAMNGHAVVQSAD